MNYKTMKQLAEEIGVSKQTIHNRIYKSNLTPKLSNLIEKIDGVICISEEGERLIKESFESKKKSKASNKNKNFDSNHKMFDSNKVSNFDGEPSNFDSIVNVLIDQLDKKDKEIERLHNALELQQQMTAVAQQKILLLEEGNLKEENVKWWWPFKKKKETTNE